MKLRHGLVLLAASAWLQAGAQTPGHSPGNYYSGDVLSDGAMQVGRYTTETAAAPAQVADALGTHVRITYPRSHVGTVGEALRYTLTRSGWRLADTSALAPDAAALMRLPLPESHRRLGPYDVRGVLAVLTGPGWVWHEDARQRVVWFGPAEPLALPDAGSASAVATAYAVQSQRVEWERPGTAAAAPAKHAESAESEATPSPAAMPIAGEQSAWGH